MKTAIVGTRRSLTSCLRASFLPALALPLCFTTACVVSDTDGSAQTTTQAQALDGGCEVQLPLAWTGLGVTCIENVSPMTIWLNYDQTYHAFAWGFGARGEAQFRCTPGPLVTDWSWCVPFAGDPP